MQNKVDKTPSNPKFSILKINNITSRLIAIETYVKKIWDPSNKETVHKFNVGYLTHPSLKKNRTHREHIIKKIQSAFKLVTLKCIKIEFKKKIYYFIGDVL